MTINLKVSEEKFFTNYLELLNPIFKLQERERKVLSKILYTYYKNRSHPEIDSLILNAASRKVIRTSLNLSSASFNNCISVLRKRGIIKDKSLNKGILNYPLNGEYNINFKLHIV